MIDRNPENQFVNDYHGHPNYLMVLVALMFFLALSFVPDLLHITGALKILMIFGGAFVKIWLVILFFMHLYYEPKVVWLIPIVGFFVVFAFAFGVMPDITFVPLKVETW